MSVVGATVDAAKKHPYWLVAGVLVVIVLFQLRGSGSASSTASNTGVTTLEEDPNQIAANTALQESANQLNAETHEADDAVAMNAANIAGQEAMANTEAALYGNYFNTVESVQNTQVAAAQEVTDRQTDAEQQVTDQANTNATGLAQATLAANVINSEQTAAYNYADGVIASASGIAKNAASIAGTGAYETSMFQDALSSITGSPETLDPFPVGDGTSYIWGSRPGSGSANDILGIIFGSTGTAKPSTTAPTTKAA